jgi:glycerophosphoryl diester phosphodiesterase
MTEGAVTRIAHAYGNSRRALEQSLDSPAVDVIELDVWLRGSALEVRHERRIGPLPILIDDATRDTASDCPGFKLGRYSVRLDCEPMELSEVLAAAAAKDVMIDVKGQHDRASATKFARRLIQDIERYGATSRVSVCGQTWSVLDALRREGATCVVRYSMESPAQWQAFLGRMEQDEELRAICISRRLLNAARLEQAKQAGINVYCWTVDNPVEAQRWVGVGVDGIISNDLGLLAGLSAA